MAESIRDKVAIIGMGLSKWGELWNYGLFDLISEACNEAFKDAGIDKKQIDACWTGYYQNETATTGVVIAQTLQLQQIPITRVENGCASGAEVIRGAALGLASKQYDLVLAVGFEKLKDVGFGGMATAGAPGMVYPMYAAEFGAAPGRYALAATAYFRKWGLTKEEGKRTLAKISVKSHHNGARNPRAMLRREITVEQAMNAPIIAWPLGLFDCCGVTDGAGAAVMCRTEDVKKFAVNHPHDYITIKGFGVAASPGWGKEDSRFDFTYWDATEAAAKQAFAQAGIKNPRKELSLAEVHDCFSIAELVGVESMGICPYGQGKNDVESGAWEQEGEIPIGISGGLKSFGHPIGASGCREVMEFYLQFQKRVEEPSRQLKDVKFGLAHNQGGFPGQFICGITITGAPDV